MAGVSIHQVAKRFGNTPILHQVGFDIADGEFLVLVGPSGCGKSTLLRMIAGLEDIDGGEIRIGDRVVNDLPVKERDIAMVFQSYALYPHLTVAQNMAFSLRLARRPKQESDERVARAAQVLALEPLLARYPRELSGGQRQRVAMGRAMVRDPQVFLFDEPLSNLDAKLRVQMRAEIKELHQRLKSTIVYVTHDQIEAMTLADRIVVLHGGHIEQIGTPLALYDTPANAFVATFIGSPSMNLIEGVVAEGGLRVQGSEQSLLPLPSGADVKTGQRVLYGVRPESFALHADGNAGVALTVAVVEPTGPETHVMARLGEQKITIIVRERLALRPGQSLQVSALEGAVHLFDAQSGRRIDIG